MIESFGDIISDHLFNHTDVLNVADNLHEVAGHLGGSATFDDFGNPLKVVDERGVVLVDNYEITDAGLGAFNDAKLNGLLQRANELVASLNNIDDKSELLEAIEEMKGATAYTIAAYESGNWAHMDNVMSYYNLHLGILESEVNKFSTR